MELASWTLNPLMCLGGWVRRGSGTTYGLCLEPALARSPQEETLLYPIQRLRPCFFRLELRCKSEPEDKRSYCCCCSIRVEVGWCLLLSACVCVAKLSLSSESRTEKEANLSYLLSHWLPYSLAPDYCLHTIDLCFLQGKIPSPLIWIVFNLMDSSIGKSQTSLGLVDLWTSR